MDLSASFDDDEDDVELLQAVEAAEEEAEDPRRREVQEIDVQLQDIGSQIERLQAERDRLLRLRKTLERELQKSSAPALPGGGATASAAE